MTALSRRASSRRTSRRVAVAASNGRVSAPDAMPPEVKRRRLNKQRRIHRSCDRSKLQAQSPIFAKGWRAHIQHLRARAEPTQAEKAFAMLQSACPDPDTATR